MKQMKRNPNIFKAKNACLDLNTVTAYSYDWWMFSKLINNRRIIFNSYRYSHTTAKHQREAKRIIDEQLGSKYLFTEVLAPNGLNNPQLSIETLESMLDAEKSEAELLLCRPRVKQSTIDARLDKIEKILFSIEVLRDEFLNK